MRAARSLFTAIGTAAVLVLGVVLVPAATAAPPNTAQATWTPVFQLTGSSWVDGVTTTAPGHVWSAGSKPSGDGFWQPYAFRTIDGVTTELPLPITDPNRWGRFISIDGVADNDIWAVGTFVGRATGSPTALVAHWNGTAWTQVSVPTGGLPAEVVSVSVRSANDVWFAGNGGDFFATQVWRWNGSSITSVPVTVTDPICFPERTLSVDLTTTANAVWLATRCTLNTDARTAGSVHRLRGGSWSLAYSTGPSGGLVSIADNGAGTVLATGFKPVVGGSLPILVAGRTTLSEVATFASGDFYWDVAARGNQVYLVGQGTFNESLVLRRTTGTNFVPEPVNGEAPLFGVAIDSAGGAWAVGPAFGGAFAGSDIGLWQRLP